jgi:zinc protease
VIAQNPEQNPEPRTQNPEPVRVDRARLPVPAPQRPFAFPAIEKSVLPNGLGVWAARHADIPVVTCTLLVRAGSAADPAGQDGLAALTLDMLDEGSGGRSAIEMHEAMARIGGRFESDAGYDGVALTLTMLSRFLDRGIALLADMAVRPDLADADFSRVRQLRLHRLAQLRDVPGAVADRTFARLLYGAHPYGHTPIGEEAALAAMTIEDVRVFHAAGITPDKATLVVVGDCAPENVRQLAGEAFAGWLAGGCFGAVPAEPSPRPPRVTVVPRPAAPQTELRIGHVAAARSTPDYSALVAANMVLGGQFLSRVNVSLRSKRGVTYGARTVFDFRRLPGPFLLAASVAVDGTGRSVEEAIDEIAAIRGSRPITDEELALGVAALTRGYARNFETAEQIARGAIQMALYDLPDDYFVQYVPRMEAVTPADAAAAAARHLDPERLIIVAVGDPDRVRSDLEELRSVP